MCMLVDCPNHPSKKTWWGCGGHVEQVMANVPADQQCKCEHEPDPEREGKFRVKKLPELSAEQHQQAQSATKF